MKTTLATILLVCASATGAEINYNVPQRHLGQVNAESNLINYLTLPGNMPTNANPAVTSKCFSQYLPMLTEVANTFSVQYQACITLANDRITQLTDLTSESKEQFIQGGNSVCSSYQNCAKKTALMEFFNCYASVSDDKIATVYQISNNATASANKYSQNLKQIKSNQDECTRTTEHTYVTDTASTFKLLDNCLKKGMPDESSEPAY